MLKILWLFKTVIFGNENVMDINRQFKRNASVHH